MYYTLPDAQKQLHALLTEVMMEKSGYVINEAIEGADRELTKLKQVKSQVKSIAHPKKADRSQHH